MILKTEEFLNMITEFQDGTKYDDELLIMNKDELLICRRNELMSDSPHIRKSGMRRDS